MFHILFISSALCVGEPAQAPEPLQAPSVREFVKKVVKGCDCPQTGKCTCGSTCDCPDCPAMAPERKPVTSVQPTMPRSYATTHYTAMQTYTAPQATYYRQTPTRPNVVQATGYYLQPQSYDPSPAPSYFKPTTTRQAQVVQPPFVQPNGRQYSAEREVTRTHAAGASTHFGTIQSQAPARAWTTHARDVPHQASTSYQAAQPAPAQASSAGCVSGKG